MKRKTISELEGDANYASRVFLNTEKDSEEEALAFEKLQAIRKEIEKRCRNEKD